MFKRLTIIGLAMALASCGIWNLQKRRDVNPIPMKFMKANSTVTADGNFKYIGDIRADDFHNKCPQCVKEGARSSLFRGGVSMTCAMGISYIDEDGNSHYSDPNVTTINYQCSRGHGFSVKHNNSNGSLSIIDGGFSVIHNVKKPITD